MTVLVTMGAICVHNGMEKIVAADNENTAETALTIGTGVIADPNVPTEENDAWAGNYVYYGAYDGTPVKYRVLDSSTTVFSADGTTKTMLLDCDNILWEGIG